MNNQKGTFKVGDRVRRIRSNGPLRLRIGDIVIISEVAESLYALSDKVWLVGYESKSYLSEFFVPAGTGEHQVGAVDE